MDQTTLLLLLVGAACLGIIATIGLLGRERRSARQAAQEDRFAVSTEGFKRCPSCGFGNLVTDATCASCRKPLP